MANFTVPRRGSSLGAARARMGRASATGCRARRGSASSSAPSGTARSIAPCATSASAPRRSSSSTSTTKARCVPTSLDRMLAAQPKRPDDRVRAGRQRELGCVRPVRARSAPSRTTTTRGCTSTARSACGPARARSYRHLVDGVEQADSWATDAHKWLNVPYDCGISVHRASGRPRRRRSGSAPSTSCSARASATRWTSRPRRHGGRARSRCGRRCRASAGTAVAELVERCCARAQQFAERPASRFPVSRSRTTWCSTRSSCASPASTGVVEAVRRAGRAW